ncbi:MAG: serine hydrolase [Bacteroidetes bacterium]|nr:MAG: serine hydrolase [Bacteroidota bacterium]
MKIYKFLNIAIFASLCLFSLETTQAQDMKSQIDDYLLSHSQPNAPGAAVLIAKDGKAIYKKAVGMANLELNVPLTTDNVFEIGSITKQFTAVSVLMLEEQGKLKVEDDITKYIPDYPTNGKTITIHHLLNHTSGIKSYTSMESFIKHARTDMTPTELIDVFKNEPMDFDPGEKFLYNNSGYIILGHIIEVVSGQSYAEFIQDHIFSKLDMKASYYGSMKDIIKNRAYGYQDRNGFVNADYLSLTLPYAAGSIMSTVDDLLIWQNAISANKLIKRNSLEKAINGSTLNNGEKIPYGYGWIKGSVNGSDTNEHSGGIFGYVTNGIFLPKENMYVIALSNCDCSNVGLISTTIAAMAIGKPFPSTNDAITLSEDKLKKWTGAYEFEDGAVRFITLDGNKLKSQREDSEIFDIYALTDDRFIFEDGVISYQFAMNKDGAKQVVMSNNGNESKGKAVDKEAPKEKEVITLAPNVLKQYNGKYELAPTFHIVVTAKGNQLFAQATGQPEFELFAESETTFFLKVVPASIDFSKNDKGEIISLTLHQGGQDMQGKKIE